MAFFMFFVLCIVTILPEGVGEIAARVKHGYDVELEKRRRKAMPPPEDKGR